MVKFSVVHRLLAGCALGGIVVLTSCRKNEVQDAAAVTIQTELPQKHRFREAALTQGVIQALEQAVVSARIAGTLEHLAVKEGDRVKKGQLLFWQDRQTLENRRTLSAETLKMAKERLNTRLAEVEIAKLNCEKAETDFKRSSSLHRDKVVSQDAFEKAELNLRSCRLILNKAEAARKTAQAEVDFAAAALEISEKSLADAEMHAPYDGIVTAKLKEEHEFCAAGTPILRLEALTGREVSALFSAVHYQNFRQKKLAAAVAFAGKTLAQVPVTYVADTIDPLSRTFEVKAQLPKDFPLASGTLCDVAVILAERESLSLPEEAILFRSSGEFGAYTAVGGKAKLLKVVPGITAQGRTEILNQEITAQTPIIVNGQYFVSDGSPIRESGPVK